MMNRILSTNARRRIASATMAMVFVAGYLALRRHQHRYDRVGGAATAVAIAVLCAVAAIRTRRKKWAIARAGLLALFGGAACCTVAFRGGDGALLAAGSALAMLLSLPPWPTGQFDHGRHETSE